jgi:nucleoid-associated protein YgaU
VRYKGYPFDPSKIISFEDFCLSAKEITITKETFDYLNRKKNFASSKGGRTKYYKVRKGDNLSVIAKKLGTTTAVLKRLNGISNPKSLKAGKVLKYI